MVRIGGTVVGLVLITTTLRVSRRLGSLHRRLLNRILGRQVEAPPPFQPGTGILNRVDRRLRDRPAWPTRRSGCCSATTMAAL